MGAILDDYVVTGNSSGIKVSDSTRLLQDWIPVFTGMTDDIVAIELDQRPGFRHPGERRDPAAYFCAGGFLSLLTLWMTRSCSK